MGVASVLASPRPFEFGGKTYQVHAVDLDMEGAFEVWLESRALDLIERHAPRADFVAEAGRLEYRRYLEQHEQWRRDGAAGTFEFGGPVATVALFRADGKANKHLLYLQLSRLQPEIKPDLVESVFRDPQARSRLLAVQGALGTDPAPDPNVPGPAPPMPGPDSPAS